MRRHTYSSPPSSPHAEVFESSSPPPFDNEGFPFAELEDDAASLGSPRASNSEQRSSIGDALQSDLQSPSSDEGRRSPLCTTTPHTPESTPAGGSPHTPPNQIGPEWFFGKQLTPLDSTPRQQARRTEDSNNNSSGLQRIQGERSLIYSGVSITPKTAGQNSAHGRQQSRRRYCVDQLTDKMNNCVAVISVNDFFKNFLRSAKLPDAQFEEVRPFLPEARAESEAKAKGSRNRKGGKDKKKDEPFPSEAQLCKVLHTIFNKLLESLDLNTPCVMKITGATPQSQHEVRPDLAMFDAEEFAQMRTTHKASRARGKKKRQAQNDVGTGSAIWAWMKMLIEVKVQPQHRPFTFANSREDGLFMEDLENSDHAFAQIISYATEVQLHQHRDWFFTAYIWRDWVRLMRWDRAGLILSETFNWYQDPRSLLSFVYAITQMTRSQQGYGSQATLASSGDMELLQDMQQRYSKAADENSQTVKRQEYLAEMLQDTTLWPVYEVSCPDINNLAVLNKYLIGKYRSLATSRSPVGRCTKAYVAYDKKNDAFVFLKDYWCAVTMHCELQIYKYLFADYTLKLKDLDPDIGAGKQFLATAIAGNMIPTSFTISQDHFPKAGGSIIPVQRGHHLIILQQIGRPLEGYKTQRELIQVVSDALDAHRYAYEVAGILHRDISANNILIGEDGRGILIDWDLCRPVQDIRKGASQHARSGTWTYMSGLLVAFPWKWNELSDDLESFLHILVLMALRWHEHNCGPLRSYLESRYFLRLSPDGNYVKLETLDRTRPIWGMTHAKCALSLTLQQLYRVCAEFYSGVDLESGRLRVVPQEQATKFMKDSSFRFSKSRVFDSYTIVKKVFEQVLAIPADDAETWPDGSDKTHDQFANIQLDDGQLIAQPSSSSAPLRVVRKRPWTGPDLTNQSHSKRLKSSSCRGGQADTTSDDDDEYGGDDDDEYEGDDDDYY